MNSFNHYSLGSCGEWLFGSAAGIGVDSRDPGYKHVIMHPQTNGPLTWVNAHHDSIYEAESKSDWTRTGRRGGNTKGAYPGQTLHRDRDGAPLPRQPKSPKTASLRLTHWESSSTEWRADARYTTLRPAVMSLRRS